MFKKSNKVFEISDQEVNRILFGDDSHDEEDDEELHFIGDDLDDLEGKNDKK